jgi:hypothetical protein
MYSPFAKVLHAERLASEQNATIEARVDVLRNTVSDVERDIELLEGRMLQVPPFQVVTICEALAKGKTVVTHDLFLKSLNTWVNPDDYTSKVLEAPTDVTCAQEILDLLPGSNVRYAVVVDKVIPRQLILVSPTNVRDCARFN